MATYEAFITPEWSTLGIAQVAVIRRRDSDLAYAAFVVDVWCLGVKDAMTLDDTTEDELAELLDRSYPDGRETIDPHCARKLIDGAVAYAERLGFAPHRDFRKARRVLSGLDSKHCQTGFSFGKEGRPFYMQGAESAEAAERVVARLRAIVGEDGFDYTLEADAGAAGEDVLAARDELLEFLHREPDSVPRFFALSGMMTAAILAPGAPQPLQIMDLLWGPEGKAWESQEELKEFMDNLTTYWNHLASVVLDAGESGFPDDAIIVDIWDEDCPDGVDPTRFHVGAMIEWSGGFMRALEAWPEKWDRLLQDPELAEPLRLIRAYAEFMGPGNQEKIATTIEAGGSLDQAVIAIARKARPELG
jgi:yecA family protein